MQMRQTYRDADLVLVLDKYLLDIHLEDDMIEEVYLKIMICGWMRRLWTLQESALARRVLLQLKNRTVDLDDTLWFDLDTSDTWISQWMTVEGAWKRAGGDFEHQEGKMLETLSDALAWRNRSIVEVEAICLGIITGLEESEILQVATPNSHEGRMIEFWRLTKIISSNILFWAGPRLSR